MSDAVTGSKKKQTEAGDGAARQDAGVLDVGTSEAGVIRGIPVRPDRPVLLGSSRPWLALVAVLLPVAVGFTVILETASVYAGVDSLALVIVSLMALSLAAGMVELVQRVLAAQALSWEVAGLPAVLDGEAVLDGASDRLRPLLRAHLEQAPVPSAASFTPYLVGLLVMLGLLGTFLGLFATLPGALDALAASSDMAALRAGLSAPMNGLMRCFGTSAAGVCASAMLGLAAVFARRSELRAARAVRDYCAGPLRSLSPMRRQLRALEHLAEQGRAMPELASGMAEAVARIGDVSEKWERSHARSVALVEARVSEGLGQVRSDQCDALAELRERLEVSLVTRLTSAIEQIQQLQTGHQEALRGQLADQLGVQGTALSDALSKWQGAGQASLQAFEQALGQQRDSHAALSGAAGQLVERFEAGLQERAGRHEEALRSHAASAAEGVARLAEGLQKLDSSAAAAEARAASGAAQMAEQLAEMTGALEARLAELGRDSAELERQRAERGTALIEEIHARGEAAVEALAGVEQSVAARSTSWLTALESLGARERDLVEDLQVFSTELRSGFETLGQKLETGDQARGERQRALAESVSALLERLEQRHGETLRGQSEQHATLLAERLQADAQLVEQLSSAVEEVRGAGASLDNAHRDHASVLERQLQEVRDQARVDAEAAEQRAIALRATLVSATEQRARELSEVHDNLLAQQRDAAEKLTDAMGSQAAGVSSAVREMLREGLDGSRSLVQEAGQLLKASATEMGSVAEMFSESIDQQRDAGRDWLESFGTLEGAVEQAGRVAATEALGEQLASTQEVFARQLDFQRELFEQLRAMRRSRGNVVDGSVVEGVVIEGEPASQVTTPGGESDVSV